MNLDLSGGEEVLVAGRYQLGELLGRGGTASVYRAEDVLLGVPRAVKFLGHMFVQTSLRDRLHQEARVMAQLSNPHLLAIYDIGIHDGVDYVVMDLAEGGSLENWLTAHGAMPPAVAVGFTIQLLCALETAHQAGIVHRDVKPANVLLNRSRVAMLADFGIALIDQEDLFRQTRAGVMMGSLAFMAPEQRQDARTVTPAADIYAAGASLYNLLTHRSPMDLFIAGASSERWRGIPEPLRDIVQRAVQLEPGDRYPSAREMALALAALSLGDPAGPIVPSEAATQAAITTLSETAAPVSRPTVARQITQEDTLLRGPPGQTIAPPHSEPPTGLPEPLPELPPEPRWPWALLALLLLLLGGGAVVWGTSETSTPASPQRPTVQPPPTSTAIASAPAPEPEPEPEPPAEPEAEATPAPAPAAREAARPKAAPAEPEAPADPPPPEAEAPTAEEPALSADPPEGADGGLAGTWKGAFNGRSTTLTLTQRGTALTGEMSVTFMSNTARHAVAGHHQPESGAVVLEDTDDSPDAGVYTATLSADGQSMRGQFKTRSDGRMVPFALRRL